MKTRKELVKKTCPSVEGWTKIVQRIRRMIAAIRASCRTIRSRLIVWLADCSQLIVLAVVGFVLFLIVSLNGCAAVRVGIHIPCPKDPVLEAVDVVGGRIEGKEVDDVIANQMTLWQHIRSLQKLGCRK